MDAEMVAMFPKGIRALIIDDDNKFIKSATMLLSVLNFDVVPCGSVTHALKSLTSGEFEGFDVILAHAAKAAACGFDFRAIVEADLLTPVVYFLPEDHQATGDEADELLSTLQAGTYIMKKPLDINEVRTRLWNVIAWHKCHLETKASGGGGAGGKRTSTEAGLDAGGKDEDRIHYKVVKARCGRKKKGSSQSGRSSAVTGGHPVAKGKEIDNEASQLQPARKKQDLGKEVQKDDSGEAFKVQQPNKAVINYQQPGQHQPKPTLPVQSIPPPTYNPKFFTSTTVPSYDPKFLFFSDAAGPSSNAATPSAMRPLYSSTPSALPPAAHQQQQQLLSRNTIFGNIVSPAAVTTTMAASTTTTYQLPQFSSGPGNQQQQDIPSLLTFGPFAYQGLPPPPVVQQDMVTPAAAGGLFSNGMAGGGDASAAAANNGVSLPFLGSSILGAEQDGSGKRAGMVGMDMHTSMADPPQNIRDASNKAAMLEALFSDDYDDCSSGSAFTALDQVLAMASSVNETTTMNTFGNINAAPSIAPQVLNTPPNGGINKTASLTPSNVWGPTLTGGALFGSFASSMVPQDLGAASKGGSNKSTLSMAHQDLGAETIGGSVAHQDLIVAPNGGSTNATTPSMVPHQNLIVASNVDQVVMENNIMGPQGHGHVPAMQGEDIGMAASVLPSDQYDDNTSFPLEALLDDLQAGPIFEFDDVDLYALMNGSIGGGATTAADAVGTSFDDSAISSLDGLEIPEGLFAEYGNNICG
ncbi:unnamed protein product [Urochloa humidicola]